MTHATTTTAAARNGRSRRQVVANAAANGSPSLGDQIGDSARQLSDTTSQEVAKVRHLVRGWLGDQVSQMRSAARSTASQVRERALDAGGRTQRYVRDEPLKSVLIAAAAGALMAGLAMLSGRRAD